VLHFLPFLWIAEWATARWSRLRHNCELFSWRSSLKGDDVRAASKRRRHPPSRADRRDMRQETSETVWNDLAYYKQENKALAEEKWDKFSRNWVLSVLHYYRK